MEALATWQATSGPGQVLERESGSHAWSVTGFSPALFRLPRLHDLTQFWG